MNIGKPLRIIEVVPAENPAPLPGVAVPVEPKRVAEPEPAQKDA